MSSTDIWIVAITTTWCPRMIRFSSLLPWRREIELYARACPLTMGNLMVTSPLTAVDSLQRGFIGPVMKRELRSTSSIQCSWVHGPNRSMSWVNEVGPEVLVCTWWCSIRWSAGLVLPIVARPCNGYQSWRSLFLGSQVVCLTEWIFTVSMTWIPSLKEDLLVLLLDLKDTGHTEVWDGLP